MSTNVNSTNNNALNNVKLYTLMAGMNLGFVGLRSFSDKNKADTFTKTIKNAAKDYTLENKKDLQKVLKAVDGTGTNKANNFISKIGNKKMFATFIAGQALFDFAVVKLISKIIDKFTSKK